MQSSSLQQLTHSQKVSLGVLYLAHTGLSTCEVWSISYAIQTLLRFVKTGASDATKLYLSKREENFRDFATSDHTIQTDHPIPNQSAFESTISASAHSNYTSSRSSSSSSSSSSDEIQRTDDSHESEDSNLSKAKLLLNIPLQHLSEQSISNFLTKVAHEGIIEEWRKAAIIIVHSYLSPFKDS